MAALVLGALGWRLGLLGDLSGRWGALTGYAFAEIVIPFPLIAAGEQAVASSLAAILIASVPLIVAVLALRFDREERATGSRLVGCSSASPGSSPWSASTSRATPTSCWGRSRS